MRSDFAASLAQLTAEKGLHKDELIEMVEAAMVSAYKKDFAGNDEKTIVVRMDPGTGNPRVFEVWDVVASADEVEDPNLQLALPEARKMSAAAVVGEKVERDVTPPNFGRIGAQTAKQVILQKIREAERDHVYGEFVDREGDIITGVVRRIDPRGMVLETGSAGKAEALLPPTEQVSSERHRMGQRIRVYLMEVNRALKGPMLIVSRAHRNFVRRMMELEIPEIFNGVVEIRAIAREPGSRSKVAVWSRQTGLDPVGACVGQRGMRIQNIVNELSGERIDIIPWSEDTAKFVASALSPARVLNVELYEGTKTASVTVPDSQLSLAIGKEGQNARLAARLTGWRVDIKSDASPRETVQSEGPEAEEDELTPDGEANATAMNGAAVDGVASDAVSTDDVAADGAAPAASPAQSPVSAG
ncbi:MAG: Transcription termination protein NusA [uncultured Chloroflexi bacterium]|uniref:Transcription termination/antitermination protein NusA n=1 Tax=uncultured Chloroflexota bacterium TaxID=166587 RepID=A0A6J4JGK9_9CHLR|nr:MAG: Transcription termination protein NusA [uncultured Chloroflexota bacterium]